MASSKDDHRQKPPTQIDLLGREVTSVVNLEEILVGDHYMFNSKKKDYIIVIHSKRT